MSTTNMALPVGHDSMTTSSISLCIGRPFRQLVDLADSADYSEGLELWLADTIEDRKLFSMFDGILTFNVAPNSTLPNTITLELHSEAQRRLNQINTLMEPIPKKVLYKNIDQSLTELTLMELLTSSYAAATGAPSTWHPVLRTVWNGLRLKDQLDIANTNGVLNSTMQEFISGFFSDSISFPTLAGDFFGSAASPLNGETPPTTCTLSNPRKITITTEEYAENKLNPKYYLWFFLKNHNRTNNRRVNFITTTTLDANNQYDHPLLNSTGLNIDLDDIVLPRTLVQLPEDPTTDVLLFPIGKLSDFHGIQLSEHDSAVQWRITDDANLDFEVQIRPGGPTSLTYLGVTRAIGVCGVTSLMDVCPTPSNAHNNLVEDIWNDWGNHINEICLELQFPAEYVIASIGQETGNVQRALALETLDNDHIDRLQTAGISQSIIDAYVNLDPEYGLNVPNPIPMNTAIKSSESTLTWGQLLQIVEVVPERMSPGIIQTLVSTARNTISWLSLKYPDIPTSFNVQAIPATNAGLFEWLLVGRHSILLATAFHKKNYVLRNSHLDFPKVAALYNAGSLRYKAGFGSGTTAVANPWVMRYNGLDYPLNTSRYYNAIKNSTTITPQSKLWRNLS